MIGFALVDLGYMGGASLHVEIFKKEKWYMFLFALMFHLTGFLRKLSIFFPKTFAESLFT